MSLSFVNPTRRRSSDTITLRVLRAGIVVSLALAFVGCASPVSDDDTKLTGKEVRELITGNTFRGAFEAQQLTMVFYADGVIRGSHGLTGSDRGTWWIEGDNYCHRWSRYFGGVRRCYQWWRRSNDYLLLNVDAFRAPNIPGRIEPGKPPGF